jgi:hypothetical protein
MIRSESAAGAGMATGTATTTVLAFVDFDDWRGRSITVRYDELCVWHDPPRILSSTVTYGTAWESGRDQELSEPV